MEKSMSNYNKWIIGVTGASGSVYFIELLRFFLNNNIEAHAVFTDCAYQVVEYETTIKLSGSSEETKQALLTALEAEDKKHLLTVHDNKNLFASVASGSFLVDGMIVLPCSMNTLASIKSGISNNLLTRAADVCIKQSKPLVLAPREMPFSPIHLENMLSLSKAGVKILVPTPGFYHHPKSINDMINFVICKILDAIEVKNELYERWK